MNKNRTSAAAENTPPACDRCRQSYCCRYVTQHIGTPRSIHDFDVLLWQLSHRDIQLFQDRHGWFLLINNPCLHLRTDGSCGIYRKRPTVCRAHSSDNCEFVGCAEDGYKRFFPDYAALERYCRKRFKRWNRRHA